jgi:glutathione S-transferase
MFFEQYEVEPNLAVARFWIAILGQREQHAAELEGKWRGGAKALDAIEEHLAGRDWLVADAFSIADISVYAYTHVAEEGGFDLGPYAATRAWIDRIASLPGYVPMEA